MAKSPVYHRSSEFKERFLLARSLLQEVYQTQSDICILTSSGTGALEAALVSLHRKDDEVLVVDSGKFGERFHKIAKGFGLAATILRVDWGKSVSVEDLAAHLKTKKFRSLCVQACETSTGTQNPIQEIAKTVRAVSPDTLLIVDGITAVGAVNMPMDAWDLDVVISGSQKAFMMPPGLSFVGLGKRAVKAMESADLPRFYFDLKKENESQRKGQSAYTPSTVLIEALIESMTMMKEEGFDHIYARHLQLAAATRRALQKMGLALASESPAVACTAVFLPAAIDGKDFLKSIRERHGFTIAGGQDLWEGKVLRLSHLGYYSAFDLLNALVAIGRELQRRGHGCDLSTALSDFIEDMRL